MRKLLLLPFCALLVLSGCNPPIKDFQEYLRYINEEENGLVKTKKIGDIEIIVKFLPVDYLVQKDLQSMDSSTSLIKDSLQGLYNNNYTFLMTIKPPENIEPEAKKDVMFKGVGSIEEYKERVMLMNFNMAEYITLSDGQAEIHPVLAHLENVYGLSKGRNIYMIFPKQTDGVDLSKAKQLDITYSDEIFDTGISHYVFDQDDITGIPKLILE